MESTMSSISKKKLWSFKPIYPISGQFMAATPNPTSDSLNFRNFNKKFILSNETLLFFSFRGKLWGFKPI